MPSKKPSGKRSKPQKQKVSKGKPDRPKEVEPAHESEVPEKEAGGSGPLATSQLPFTVVGIGASAGGLEACRHFLEYLPADTGMAFVLVQHLDPRHESLLTNLLARAAKIPVEEIRDQTPLAPNRVYVIPPNRGLRLKDGRLQLLPQKKNGFSFPIDEFFKSLAEGQGYRTIGIVLSGNGSDGTLGLKAIKAEGGITFAQDQGSARYFSMPGSAIAAGVVDLILPPEKMAEELGRLSRQPTFGEAGKEPVKNASGLEESLGQIFSMLRALSGVDFSLYKPTTIKRRIMRRVVLNRFGDLRQYVRYLRENPAEISAPHQDLLINVTEFFRDPQVFLMLKKKVFPKIFKGKTPDSPVRIWVTGCSTGEEVYSMAIAVHEYVTAQSLPHQIQIFGTDISEGSLIRARAGVYPFSIEAPIVMISRLGTKRLSFP